MNHTIAKRTRTLTATVAAGALLAVPAAALASKPDHQAKGHGKAVNCAKAHSVGFSVVGTLVEVTADNPLTAASEATVTLKVLHANGHARRSGDIADQDTTKPGIQVADAVFTVPVGDAYKLRLRGYQGSDTPSVGDRVKVNGRIARTARHCAPDMSVADRLGATDVKKVTIHDRDAD